MWIVIVEYQDNCLFHSAHIDRGRAIEWRDCKRHEGEDAVVVELSAAALDEIITAREDA